MSRCKPGDLCVVVGGLQQNLGIFLTVTAQYRDGSQWGLEGVHWLFEKASKPLRLQHLRTGRSLPQWASNSFDLDSVYPCVMADTDLWPIRGSTKDTHEYIQHWNCRSASEPVVLLDIEALTRAHYSARSGGNVPYRRGGRG